MNLNIQIHELEISVRLSNICYRENITTLKDLFNVDLHTLMRLEDFGSKTLKEVNSLRIKYGFDTLSYYKTLNIQKEKYNNSNRSNVYYSLYQILNLNNNIFLNCKIEEIDLSNKLVKVLHSANVIFVKDILRKKITPEMLGNYNDVGIQIYVEFKYFYTILINKQPNKTTINYNNSKVELIHKNLKEINLSFSLYNALIKLGIQKLNDILVLNIKEKDIIDQIGYRGKIIKEFNLLFNKLKSESEYINTEILPSDDSYLFDISKLLVRDRKLHIKFFNLDPVVDNFLENNEIILFEDLKDKNKDNLIALSDYISENIKSLINMLEKSEYNTSFIPRNPLFFPVWLDSFLDKISERDAKIFKYRFGLYGEKYTLEKIGTKFILTRERIRQILNKLIQKFRKNYAKLLKNLERYLISQVETNLNSINANHIFRLIESHDVFKLNNPKGLYINILNDLFPQIPFILNNNLLASKLSYHEEKIETELINYLRNKLPLSISKNNFVETVIAKSKNNLFDFIRVIIISNKIKFWHNNDKIQLTLKRITFESAISAIINSSKILLTMEELKRKIGYYFSDYKNILDDENFRLRLVSQIGIYRFDNDLFGNIEHLLMICSNIDEIKDICFNEIETRKIPTAIYDFVPIIDFNKIKIDPENKNYIIDAIISTDKRFVKLDRLLYGLKKWGKIKYPKVSDKIYEILKNNINPLHLNAMFVKLQHYRSVLEITVSTTLRNDKRVINYTPGWYGLKEFHYQNLNYLLNHSPYIDKLIYSLIPGTSLNGLIKLLNAHGIVDIQKLENIFTTDKRFIVYTAEDEKKVFHKNWSTHKLITSILKLSENGISLHELLWKLNDSFGEIKQFSLKEIKSALSSMIEVIYIEDKIFLEKEVRIAEDHKEKIIDLVLTQMSEFNILYNLEEMYDLFINFMYSEDNISFHQFRNGFYEIFNQKFEQIGTNIFRRKN